MNFTEQATHIVANTAMAYYRGEMNSVEAFRDMDRALLSWNYDPAMLNASRELFDAVIDAAMDFDLMEQALLDAEAVRHGGRVGHWSDAEWQRVFADLDRLSIRDLTG